MPPRCGILLLACAALIGFNLLSTELQDVDETFKESGASSPGTKVAAFADLFAGEFVLRANGSELLRGSSRFLVGSQRTGLPSVDLSTLAVTLQEPGSFRTEEMSIYFWGLSFVGAHKVTASGVSDPHATGLLGPNPCHIDAVFELSGTLSESRPPQARLPNTALRGNEAGFTDEVDAKARGADIVAGEASSGDSATEVFKQRSSLVGKATAQDCGFSLDLSARVVDFQRVGRKVMHYAVWTIFLTFLQMRCYFWQIAHTYEGLSAGRLSLTGIAMQALMDAYDSFLHLSLSAGSHFMFNMFAVVSVVKFIFFTLLEVRYLLITWRQCHREIFAEGWDAVRRELSRFYTFFYGTLFGGLVLIFSFMQYLDAFVLALQFYWVPQIVHDVRTGCRNALLPQFVLGISVTRSLSLLYLWGCPSNIFSMELYPQLPRAPSQSFCLAAVSLQSLQLTIMATQRLWGPRWFVPRWFLPHAYNYYRAGPDLQADGAYECVICMAELVPAEVAALRHPLTPCGHRFHSECLERWMDIKMECPTCRAELPPLS